MDALMSALQWGHLTRTPRAGETATSPSQARHLKCIIGVMRVLVVILILAMSAQAQTLAETARKERERQAKVKPTQVVIAEGVGSAASAPAAGKDGEAKTGEAKTEAGKPADEKAAADKAAPEAKPKEIPIPQPPAFDPVKFWNDELDKLRTKIRDLQDQETAVQLQISQLNNQIYAPVIDQAAKDEALAQVGQAQQTLAAVRAELDQTRKALDALQLQGPPKK